MSQDLVTREHRPTLPDSPLPVPAIISAAGAKASEHFLEFFGATGAEDRTLLPLLGNDARKIAARCAMLLSGGAQRAHQGRRRRRCRRTNSKAQPLIAKLQVVNEPPRQPTGGHVTWRPTLRLPASLLYSHMRVF
jgi:hypothetical protein